MVTGVFGGFKFEVKHAHSIELLVEVSIVASLIATLVPTMGVVATSCLN